MLLVYIVTDFVGKVSPIFCMSNFGAINFHHYVNYGQYCVNVFYSGRRIIILSFFVQMGVEVCLQSHTCTKLPLGHISNARLATKAKLWCIEQTVC